MQSVPLKSPFSKREGRTQAQPKILSISSSVQESSKARSCSGWFDVDIAPDLTANQLNVRNGALILQVPANSLAARSGLLPTTRGFAGNIVLGDIVIAVDNKPVKSKADLDRVLDDYSVGDQVVLKVQRGDATLELPITLEERIK